MSSNFNRPLKFEVRLPSEHPQLLQGLDEWLRLDLISDAQVKQICRQYLVCQVDLQNQTVPKTPTTNLIARLPQPAEKPKVTAKPSFLSNVWQSLRAEFSVRWLLFLGMFTVVVSSGALAASQWERFTAVLQYGVLFAYTLGFFGLSFWTGKQANLRLTSGALHIVTMLLIPINFWAMDSFGLWQNPISLVLVGIAAIILTGITALLCKQSIFTANIPVSKLSLINILGLSYLHWGWKFSAYPLIAVYLAVIGTTIITVFHRRIRREGGERVEGEEGGEGGEGEEGEEKRNSSQLSWGKNVPAATIVYASMLVLLRAIFAVGVEIENLGLAIGIYGWLIAWLAQKEDKETRRQGDKENFSTPSSPSTPRHVLQVGEPAQRSGSSSPSSPSPPSPHPPLQTISGILLFLGWYATVVSNPWQAIAISGLGLWFFNSRLHLYSLKRDLTAFFAVGLQSMWLTWRLLPTPFQSSIITTATQFTNSQNHPWALLSVGLFPYIIFMVAFTNYLRRRENSKPSEQGIYKSSQQNIYKPSQQNIYKSSEQDARTTKSSQQDIYKSSEQDNSYKSSEQDARTTKSSQQDIYKSSEQGIYKSSEQGIYKSSEQDARTTKPSEQNIYKSSEQDARTTKKPDLANFGEILTLVLGVILTAVALENPTLRSLNLLLSTIILTIVSYQKFHKTSPPSTPSPPSLLPYLTHITAILTLFSWIDLFFPSLSQQVWAVVCLVIMVAEWLFSVGDGIWRRSAWHIGLALAGLSYLLLLTNLESTWNGNSINSNQAWGLAWLITPVTLSIIASRSSEERKNRLIISTLTIIFAQFLIPLSGIRLIGLAAGAAVMFVNTRYLRNKLSAVITVLFGLSLIFAGVWENASFSYAGWFVFTAVITLCLWVIRLFLKRENELESKLVNIYAAATDKCAIALCSCELLLLSLHAISIYWFTQSNILLSAIAATLLF